MREHPVDRWTRIGIAFTVVITTEDGFFYNSNGSCNFTTRTKFVRNPVTKLSECEICGKISTPKKVNYKSGLYGWLDANKKTTLCMGCFNKVSVLVNKEKEAKEIKALIKKLNSERLKCQRSLTQVS